MADPLPDELEAILESADASLAKLEMVGGVPVWEGMPSPKHQRLVKVIDQSVRRKNAHEGDCGCYSLLDVSIRFPDGSFQRPDVSIFGRQPDENLESVDFLPEAVVEVLSKGYEAKDLQIGLPFYLAQGIRDVVMYNPRTLVVLHTQGGTTHQHVAPVELEFLCGCLVTIPV